MTGLKTRILYGAGGAVYAVKESAYTMFILLFYTQVLGLNGATAGIIIALSLLWDGVSDPLVGALSDRLVSRHGRRHPFMLAATIPTGLGFIGLFTPPAAVAAQQWQLAAWLLFWSLWIRTFVTLFSIPHLALSAEITRDYRERSQVLGMRMAFMFLGGVLLPAVALTFIFPEEMGIDRRFDAGRYPLYGALSCAVVWLMASITMLGTRKFATSASPATSPSKGGLAAIGRDLSRTLVNRTFRLIICYELCVSISWGAVATLNMLAWTYFWEFSATEVSIILSVPSVIAVGLVMLSLGSLSERFQKYQLLKFAIIGLLLDMAWLYPLRVVGLLPDNGTAVIFWLNFVFMLVFIYCFLLRAICSSSIVADITDEHELDHGVRQEAAFFSVVNFLHKIASIFGPLYAGVALSVIGLETGMLPGEVEQPILNNLAHAMALGAIPAMLAGLYFVLKINMGRARVEDIQAALGNRAAEKPTCPTSTHQ